MQRQWLQQPQPAQQQYSPPQLMQLQMTQAPVCSSFCAVAHSISDARCTSLTWACLLGAKKQQREP